MPVSPGRHTTRQVSRALGSTVASAFRTSIAYDGLASKWNDSEDTHIVIKRPRDANQLGKLMVDIATGQVDDGPREPTGRAVGGHARARSMSADRRREIATKANTARWRDKDNPESASPQPDLDIRPDQPIRVAFERIFKEAETAAEKGRWFEHLFMAMARDVPDFQVADIWPWREWPDRSRLTELDGRDIGIDLVAKLDGGALVAIQCKCYDHDHRVSKPNVDSFISASDGDVFDLRWIVSTCPWNVNAENAIRNKNPEVRRIDFLDFLDRTIRELGRPAIRREPKPLQAKAIEAVVDGLADQGNDRGKLVMACGTGKTFTSLRVSERLVPDDGRIIFTAPSISLVSQARREWLTHTDRPMSALVVCSDKTAGGKGECHEAGPDDLVCPVLSDPAAVASHLAGDVGVKAVFCTYQSLDVVLDAQRKHSAACFDLAVADEAHRTTGVDVADRKVSFQHFHHRLDAAKRIYMTATERIYKQRSKDLSKGKGLDVVDMSDVDIYGPLLHKLKFKDAVAAGELSDYRVIVLGVHESHLTPGIRASLEQADPKAKIGEADLTRLYGTALAMNGYVRGGSIEVPPRLPRTLAFASRINRSKWFADTLSNNSTLKGQITRRLRGLERAMDVKAEHLDADSSAIVRSEKLRWLNDATRSNESRMISNVGLFTEGVDVPALDAVSFLDPRKSQVDIVQSVGRVMRKAEGKKFGYIVVPVPLEEGEDVADKLSKRGDDYRAVGQVLRALQSHDERLAETPGSFVSAHQTSPPPRDQRGTDESEGGERRQLELELKPVDAASIYTHVAAASGLGSPGQMTAMTIADAVKLAASIFMADGVVLETAKDVLELPAASDKEAATVAALLLCNACLLHKRLKSETKDMAMLAGLDGVARAKDPVERLSAAWESILDKDYEPVFRPALALLTQLPRDDEAKKAVRVLAERAESLADSLTELGYDHAGPLYHGILDSAESDGAFYTNNVAALMLARLALPAGMVDWSDYRTATSLRVLDPACGTGTLLMAALKTIKDRMGRLKVMTPVQLRKSHKKLVEKSIRGLDINYHATQLAASNLTLGAPTVDYEGIHVHTMRHGPQPDGTAELGSLELLPSAIRGDQVNLVEHEKQTVESTSNTPQNKYPDVQDVDVVLMNPPFTENTKSSTKFGRIGQLAMRAREDEILAVLRREDPDAADAITRKTLSTFFTPLADCLLKPDQGVLAKVIPFAACVALTGEDERRFLADRFEVSIVVTSHAKQLNFSGNTRIHECLLVCRRKPKHKRKKTLFVALSRMPANAEQAIEVADAIASGKLPSKWGGSFCWPSDRVQAGDWSACQWLDGTLAEAAHAISELPTMRPLGELAHVGPAHVRSDVRNPLDDLSRGPYRVLWTHKTGERTTMGATHEYSVAAKTGRIRQADMAWQKASRILLANKINTNSSRVAAVFLDAPAMGSVWTPITPHGRSSLAVQRAWCAWFNSTPGLLGFLHRRGRKLTYSDFMPNKLQSMPCPDPSKTHLNELGKIFSSLRKRQLLPWPDMDKCLARAALDNAVATTAGLDRDQIADWRARLATEPSVARS